MSALQELMMANYGEAGKRIDLSELMRQREHEKHFLGTQETIEELVARLTGQQAPGIYARSTDSQEQSVGGNIWNPWSQ